MPITTKVVSKKVNFYLGAFVAYFIACFILLIALDYCQIGKTEVRQLFDSAYSSNTYIPSLSHDDLRDSQVIAPSLAQSNTEAKMIFSRLKKKDYKVSRLIEDEKLFKDLSEKRNSHKTKSSNSNNVVKAAGYSSGFYAYINQRRTHLGCKPLWYPNGQWTLCCKTWKWQEGVMEDFIVFLCNNHSVLNCIYSCDGAPVDRTGNRLIYISQNCLAFFLSAISGSVFDYIGLSNRANIVFDILITAPATIAIAKVMKLLYVCPIGFSVDFRVANPWVVTAIRWLGKLVILPILAFIGGLLVMSAVFSRGHGTVSIVVYFFLQVQVYGFFLELVLSRLMFVSTTYVNISIELPLYPILLLEVGRRYVEMIHHKGLLIEGKDYHYRCNYICCLLRVEYIYTFDDAVKKGYVQEADRIQVDTEMQAMSVLHQQNSNIPNDVDGNSSMLLRSASTTIYEAHEISSQSSFQHDAIANGKQNDNIVNDDKDNDARISLSTVYNNMIPTLENGNFMKSNENWNQMRHATLIPTDEELYRQYQHELVTNSSSADGLASESYDFDAKALTFEEWKIERKKFKAGKSLHYIYKYNQCNHFSARTRNTRLLCESVPSIRRS